MEFVIILIAIVALYPLLLCIRIVVIRLIFNFKLKKLCRKKQYKLYKNSFFWLLGLTRKNGCDFYVETDKKVLAVKFLMTLHKKGTLTFVGDSHYYFSQSGHYTGIIKGRLRNLPYIDFCYKIRPSFRNKNLVSFLLISPACRNICIAENIYNPYSKPIGDLEFISYFTIISQSKLRDIIEKS